MSTTALLSTTYFGPIQWYQKLYRHDECRIERMESFQKQTYRNRCVIATTSGPQSLTLPIERGQRLIRDIQISDHGNWRHLHWNALSSAYGESPFFEFYADDIRPFFERKWKYLFDYNWDITQTMCQLLDIHPLLTPTEDYLPEADNDFRNAIQPKHPAEDPGFTPRRYYQVYERKLGFLPNLSILDLLFNMGNEAIFYL
jgi:hypothetical protein